MTAEETAKALHDALAARPPDPAKAEAALATEALEQPASAANRLAAWALRWGPPPRAWLATLLGALRDSPDPAMALLAWERWIEASDGDWKAATRTDEFTRLATTLFGQSQFLTEILLAEPSRGAGVLSLRRLARAWSRARLDKELRAVLAKAPASERRRALCDWRRRHLLRIGLRDILGRAQVEELTRELSDVADAVVQAALDLVWEEFTARWGEPRSEQGQPVGLAVLGMGKLGGRELNFSSDIDLIFIYGAEGETAGVGGGRAGRVQNHHFMRRLCERLIAFVGAVGPEGRLYRVDMRLRPEGSVGPIARSLESLEVYFGSQARLWERLAYTKARVVAHRAPADFTAAVESAVRRFSYAQAPGPELAHELATLKYRIDREVALSVGDQSEVKRGSGGIREIEFVVGLFQLVHGRTWEDLRAPGLLETLRGLERRHVLTDAAGRRLRRAYETLRRIEHRLQMMNEFQTHTLPAEPRALERLARRLGWDGSGGEGVRRRFLADLNQVSSMVHQAFLQHIGAPEVTGLAADVAAVLDETTPEPQAAEVLARFGLADPAGCVGIVRALGRGGADAYVEASAQRTFERLLPALLAWCPQVPSPDLALRQLARFIDAYKARGVLFALMAEQPQLVEVLMRLFGASELLGGLLAQHPEFFDSVVARGLGLALPTEILEDFWERIRPRDLSNTPRLLDALRTLRLMFTLAIALRHLLGLDPWTQLARQLTGLAEFCLAEAWRALVDQRAATPPPVVCLALGKFGGREINIESDLDVIFVCEPPAALTAAEAAEWTHEITRRGERLMTASNEPTRRGTLFALDTRLRPEGRNAPLVSTSERLVSYFAADAQLWEFQSFLRARPVAGDLALGARTIAAVHGAMRARLGSTELVREIVTMRRRLEENAEHPGGEGALDLKRDPGGIVDVEFLVQFVQLQALRDTGAAPEVNTAEALAAMGDGAGLRPEEWMALRRHLLTLRAAECQLRLLQGTSSSAIPADSERWRRLAVAHLGPRSTAEELRDRLRTIMGAVRSAFERVLVP